MNPRDHNQLLIAELNELFDLLMPPTCPEPLDQDHYTAADPDARKTTPPIEEALCSHRCDFCNEDTHPDQLDWTYGIPVCSDCWHSDAHAYAPLTEQEFTDLPF